MASPLAHLRVLDLCDLRGALAGRMLADLGADVLKVEPPGGEASRLRPPFAGDRAAPDRSLAFLFRNANKGSVANDLTDRSGRARFDELLERADVLLENLSVADRGRLGLDPTALRARHPHLLHVAMADFGLDGPRAGWTAEPICALAASGALYSSGLPDLPPCNAPGHAAHDCASIYGVAGALAALLDRARSGTGQTVEVSVQEAALAGLNPWSIPLADYARRYPALPVLIARNGDGPYTVLKARDGYLRVLPATPKHWRGFWEWLGKPEALAGVEWEAALYRIANQDVIRAVASDALASRGREEAIEQGRRFGFPIVPCNTPEEFVSEAQTRSRACFRATGFPHVGEAPFAALPCEFSRTPVSLHRPAPSRPGRDAYLPPREPEAPGGPREARPALDGVLVVGLTCGAVGPEACGLLRDLGAEVIKIESRANLDFLRRVTLDGDPNHSWTFNEECRGQRSVCLDLSTARGREIARSLCKLADVVVENNRGGVAAAWGLDYDDVAKVNPDVIYLCSQGFGRGGPLGGAPSFGPLNSTFAGVNGLWNHPAAPYPAGISLNHPDHIASKLGAVAVLAALEHRRRTGEGQRIDMSQSEAAAFLVGEVYLLRATTGRSAAPIGNRAQDAVPHGVYPAAGTDRWVAVAVASDQAFARLCEACRWPHDPALATLDGRIAARGAIDERLAEWTSSREAEAAAAELQAAGISAMAVQNGDDHRADPHLAARGAIVTVQHEDLGAERHAANPIRLSRTPMRAPAAAPLLGADSPGVLSDTLGLAADEIERLIAEGVCS
jgi:crotonobetainyl-CoA:carnitine CoA-transferase CaiB-like acyl-CoA transferase